VGDRPLRGLGRHYGKGSDAFRLRLAGRGGARRWALDLGSLERTVTRGTRVIMVCNPNNPTGAVLTEDEMDAVVRAARRVRAWIVADEVYRGAEIQGDAATPSFWGRYEEVVVTSGLSKAFGLPGLRIGWLVAPRKLIAETWKRHDYTTLPIDSARLVDRIRERQSVLLVPGAMFGFGRGLRFGFGYNIARTLEGLALAGRELKALQKAAAG
jgi:aspartate/methionine/tyrosine aminotransferase